MGRVAKRKDSRSKEMIIRSDTYYGTKRFKKLLLTKKEIMKDFELDERKGEVVDTKYLYGKRWDVLESFLFDHSHDQDYFLLSFDGNDV